MGLIQKLAVFALKQVVVAACKALPVSPKVAEQAAGKITAFLDDRTTDHSQRLVKALEEANASAWRALEIALAGESFWERCQVALARSEDQAFRQQVKAFLDATPLPELAGQKEVRARCLEELRAARKAGLLTGATIDPRSATQQAAAFARFGDPLQLVEAEWQLVLGLADELKKTGFRHLGDFLARRPAQGQPLLVSAVRYFFRRAIEEDAKLFQGLAFAKLEALDQAQERRFQALGAALRQHGRRVEDLLGDVRAVVTETHEAVLVLQGDLRGTNERITQLGRDVQRLLEQYQLSRREVRPGDSLSIRTDQERQLVKQVVARYRALPEGERRQVPALLHAVGKLEVVAGDFAAAQTDFQAVAALVGTDRERAEAYYNAYQAALERRDWPGALQALLQALKRDARRFAPFPVGKYQPQRILGAGGFGVTFLCRHKYMEAPVAVKALRPEDLADDADKVFSEAQLLRQLDHPAIIRISDCGYADVAARARPFLVMDYCPGLTLEEHVDQHGPLALADLLAVARAVAEGLHAAHGRNIFHRDVKPANLLVRKGPGGWTVKLIDFGLALRQKVVQGSRHAETVGGKKTRVGHSIAGTLDYAAPEQLGRRSDPVGPYSDVYGFGKLCCFALFQTPLPTLKHWQSIPQPLAQLLGDCLAEAPRERVPDFGAVLKRLPAARAAGARPAGSAPAPVRPAARKPRRRSGRWVAALLALLLLAGAGGGLYYYTQVLQDQPALGTVALEIDPADAEVSLDGKTVARARVSAGTVTIEAEEGTHDLIIRKVGFEAYRRQCTWKAGANEPIKVHLEPLVAVRSPFKPPPAARSQAPPRPADPRIVPLAAITLRPGESVAVEVQVERRGHKGAIPLRMERLPEQVTARAADLAANRDRVRLELTAAADAPAAESAARIVATIGGRTITGRVHVSVLRPAATVAARELRVLRGHTAAVTCAAFSSDGRVVLSGSRDQSVRLWDAKTGQEKKQLGKHTGAVLCLAHDAKRARVISGGEDKVIRLWDVGSATALAASAEGPGPVTALALSSPSRHFASGGWQSLVQLWELTDQTIKFKHGCEGHDDVVRCLTFLPGNTEFLSGSADQTVRLWSVGTGREVRCFRGHKGEVLCVAASAVSQVRSRPVLSGGADRLLILWNLTSGKEVLRFKGHQGAVTGVAFAPDGSRVLSGSADGTVRLWDAKTARELGRFTAHQGPVRCVAFSSDGRSFLSAGDDKTIRLWEVTGKDKH